MVNPENEQKEVQPQETEKPVQLQPEKSSSEIRDERVSRINQELEGFDLQASTPDEVQQIQKQREQEYRSKVAELEQGLGTELSDESKDQIHQNMVGSAIEQAQKDNERFDNLQRLRKAAETLSPEDFVYFEKILGNQEGRIDQLYDLKGKVLHTTPDFAFRKILKNGRILQDVHNDDTKKMMKGVYLTDADSELGLTFHTLWDHAKSPSDMKALDSSKYFDQIQEMATFFWSTPERQKKSREYVKDKGNGLEVKTKDDLVKFFQQMRNGLTAPEKNRATGVTLAFEKDGLSGLSKEGTNQLNRYTEQRLFSDDGLLIDGVKTLFVPESQMSTIRQMVHDTALEDVEIRPSEELEVIRMVRLLEEK